MYFMKNRVIYWDDSSTEILEEESEGTEHEETGSSVEPGENSSIGEN